MFHDISTITSRTVNQFKGHTPPLSARRSTHDAVPSAIFLYHGCSRKTTNPEHYHKRRGRCGTSEWWEPLGLQSTIEDSLERPIGQVSEVERPGARGFQPWCP